MFVVECDVEGCTAKKVISQNLIGQAPDGWFLLSGTKEQPRRKVAQKVVGTVRMNGREVGEIETAAPLDEYVPPEYVNMVICDGHALPFKFKAVK